VKIIIDMISDPNAAGSNTYSAIIYAVAFYWMFKMVAY